MKSIVLILLLTLSCNQITDDFFGEMVAVIRVGKKGVVKGNKKCVINYSRVDGCKLK